MGWATSRTAVRTAHRAGRHGHDTHTRGTELLNPWTAGAVVADGPIKAEKTLSGEVVARCDYGCCQTRI